MLQHSRVMFSISYISWLQLAAEYGGCSQIIVTSPLIFLHENNLFIDVSLNPCNCPLSLTNGVTQEIQNGQIGS